MPARLWVMLAGMNLLAAASIAFGAFLIASPRVIADPIRRRRERRLEHLRRGAEERHFEERRELETYRGPSDRMIWRVVGLCLLASGVLQLIPLYVPAAYNGP